MSPILTLPLLLLLLACAPPAAEHGHPHGPGAGAHDDGHAEAESLAVTRWTESHELFVELDAPVAGQAYSYHAHVTRLEDNHAASSGALTIRFEQDGFVVESHRDEAVARAGIFAAQAAAPTEPGEYRLVFGYVDGEERAEWDCGVVTVGGEAGLPQAEEATGEINFLKESQWQVPFSVAPAAVLPLADSMEMAAQVRPAPSATSVVAAPVEGLLAWTDALPVVGRRVERGEPLAALIPVGSATHWARLQADLSTARVDRDLAEKDLARLRGLSAEGHVSERRVEQAEADLARAEASLAAGQRQVTSLTSGSSGGVKVRAPAAGVIVAVGAEHGQRVAAGTPLVSVRSGPSLLLEGMAHERAEGALNAEATLSVHRGDWPAPVDLRGQAALLTESLVYDPRTLSAPVHVLVAEDVGLNPGDLIALQVGVGLTSPRLVVPREAVVESNGQAVIFVQRTGESFTRRRVTLGASDASHVEVLSGLEAGEMVVVAGGFDVHVASLSGALESHRH